MSELLRMVPKLDGIELKITAIVGDRYREEYVEGFSTARIFNSSLKLEFLGGSPQVIKPAMPFTCYVSITRITNVMAGVVDSSNCLSFPSPPISSRKGSNVSIAI